MINVPQPINLGILTPFRYPINSAIPEPLAPGPFVIVKYDADAAMIKLNATRKIQATNYESHYLSMPAIIRSTTWFLNLTIYSSPISIRNARIPVMIPIKK
jgi:hypothetical protein